MLTKPFNSQKPASFAIAPLFAAALWLIHGFIDGKSPNNENGFVFYQVKLLSNNFFPDLIISFIFLIAGAILVKKLVEKHQLLGGPSNLPAIIYILINSCHSSLYSFHPTLILNILVILILDKLFSIYREERVFPSIFDIGLLAGISSILHPPFITILAFVFISISIIRAFSWREWGILGTGIVLPFYATGIILYCIDPNFNPLFLFEGISFQLINLNAFSADDLPIVAILTIIIFLTVKTWIKELKKGVVKGKKMFSVINWLCVLSFLSLFMELSFYFPNISILFLPFTLIFSNYFYNNANIIIKEVVFFLLFIVVFYTQIVLL